VLLQQIGGMRLIVVGAGLIFLDPDADQVAREVVALAKTVQRLAAEVFLDHAALELDAVCAVSGHGFHPSKARPPGQFAISQLSGPRGALQSDFTYVATWAGFVYVAFVIDAFARRIVGWRVSRSMQAGFVLDALEQALHDRRPVQSDGLIHHSDRGVQYVSIRYTERLAEVGIKPSVGTVGDSYDNALAETVIGLFKTEVIHRRGPWRSIETVEFATLEWVDWFNNRRLLEPIGNIPPAEAEHRFYAQSRELAMVA
jgi:putative transposase